MSCDYGPVSLDSLDPMTLSWNQVGNKCSERSEGSVSSLYLPFPGNYERPAANQQLADAALINVEVF